MTVEEPRAVLSVSAVCVVQDGRLLVVRKRGTERFMLPGGKPEPGEDAVTAACREVSEEIGALLRPDDLVPLGVWQAEAANEAATDVIGTVFTTAHHVTPVPAAEIEEIGWLDLETLQVDGTAVPLAPMLTGFVLPALLAAQR